MLSTTQLRSSASGSQASRPSVVSECSTCGGTAGQTVNPVDVKVRASSDPGGEPKIVGYDAAVTLFRPGYEVWYAGSIARPGTDAQFCLVDERIVGPKPASLDFAQAAALPLTTLTACRPAPAHRHPAGARPGWLTERLDGITAENLRRAHAAAERGSAIGKTVIAGF